MPFLIAALIVISLWLICFWLGITFLPDWATRGQFGDLFGAVNALFSGLAFSGLIYAIFLQRKELSLQRQELRLQREEMEKSRAALSQQAEAQIAAIEVSGLQAQIDSQKLQAEAFNLGGPGRIKKNIESIDNLGSQMLDIAEALRKKQSLE